MQINKKAAALLSAGVIIGTAGVVALQTHAQKSTVPTSSVQTALSAQATITNNNIQGQQDKDNIQDPGGIEKPDTPEKIQGAEVQDDQGSDKDITPDNPKDGASQSSDSAD